ncbi:MAG: hypothetical protein HYU66_28585 [Armatimonadetes bacterium]|nr:hypothetical protein [Armatimonadota bacterium]
MGYVPLLAVVLAGVGADEAAEWYWPGWFDHSTVYLMASSHNDIAYLDDPRGTADYRSENLILPALELMSRDPTFCLDVETTLYLKEFLERHPERLDEVRQRVAEHRLSFGGRYTQFYEAVYGGEALARQMYLGRKWLRRTLGGECDTHIVWDTDVPQRSLQGPQVFAKSGIKYLMIGRFPHPGVHVWESPDGSGVVFCNYLYERGWGSNPGHPGPAPGTPVERYVGDLLEGQRPFFEAHRVPNFGNVIMSDSSCPGHELIDTVNAYNQQADALEARTGAAPPRMKLATAETYLATLGSARAELPRYRQDWPNPWGYHHQPSHERMVSAARRGYHQLVAAERFAAIAGLLDPEDRPYPQQTLNAGWEGLIYPDHGWCGERTLETIRVFAERLQRACDAGQGVYGDSLRYIARRVKRNKAAGPAVVVFNPLSWQRTGPVEVSVSFERGERRPGALALADRQGKPVPSQWMVARTWPDGSVREAAVCFVAEAVPSIGYTTYYLAAEPQPKGGSTALRRGAVENRFYRLQLGARGIRSLLDKETGQEVFDTAKFQAGEPFMLGVGTTPLWPFEYTFYPDNRRTETLDDLGRLSGKLTARVVESGDVRTVIGLQRESPHVKTYQEITLYHALKRVDLSTELEWDGSRRRELRLAFPLRQPAGAQVSYDVPFGVVEVGRNEMGSTMPREVQNWMDVSGEQGGVTLAVGATCLNEFRDQTTNPLPGPMLQPVLLCTLLDLEIPGQAEHPWWTQAGRHDYHYALTTHPGTWRQSWRFGWEFSNPLAAVVLRDLEDADVKLDQYTDEDPPEQRHVRIRTHTHGTLPEEYSFCSVTPDSIVVSTLKQAEDDDGVVVRYFDMEGRDARAELSFFAPVSAAEHTNLIEEEPQPIAQPGNPLRLPCGPYSIETVKLAVPRRPAAAAPLLPFTDPMEYAEQAAADAVWAKHAPYRRLILSTDQNHTPGGTRSLSTGGLYGFAYVPLPTDTGIVLEAWFYDTGDPDAYGAVIAAPDVPSNPRGSAEFGVFPSPLFGGAGGGSAHYTSYTGTGDWARQDTGIVRSVGWHKVTFRVTPAGGSIHFDDKLIATAPALVRTRRLYLGNPWGGKQPLYFDDVSVRRAEG